MSRIKKEKRLPWQCLEERKGMFPKETGPGKSPKKTEEKRAMRIESWAATELKNTSFWVKEKPPAEEGKTKPEKRSRECGREYDSGAIFFGNTGAAKLQSLD